MVGTGCNGSNCGEQGQGQDGVDQEGEFEVDLDLSHCEGKRSSGRPCYSISLTNLAFRLLSKRIALWYQETLRCYALISVAIGRHPVTSSFGALLSCAFKLLVEFSNTVRALITMSYASFYAAFIYIFTPTMSCFVYCYLSRMCLKKCTTYDRERKSTLPSTVPVMTMDKQTHIITCTHAQSGRVSLTITSRVLRPYDPG